MLLRNGLEAACLRFQEPLELLARAVCDFDRVEQRFVWDGATRTLEADKVLAAGYKPKVPLSEGIAKMTRWYMEQGRHQSPAWNVPPAEPAVA
jgi:nucleoside-diphosphate-sugar epimerase